MDTMVGIAHPTCRGFRNSSTWAEWEALDPEVLKVAEKFVLANCYNPAAAATRLSESQVPGIGKLDSARLRGKVDLSNYLQTAQAFTGYTLQVSTREKRRESFHDPANIPESLYASYVYQKMLEYPILLISPSTTLLEDVPLRLLG